jgi:hypothetical protein
MCNGIITCTRVSSAEFNITDSEMDEIRMI